MTFNWLNIRSFNGSQNSAFEELVCQLARAEEIAGKEDFYRVGTPDGGVEAYCIVKGGKEIGWQAKYFTSIESSQWGQLTKSFKTALKTHPKLIKYIICIPLDRADARIKGRKSLKERWDDKVEEWKKFAQSKGREIEIEYWGSSELIDRLSKEEHAGRKKFWFSGDDFSNSWFSKQVNDSIDNLGARYTANLNVELDIAKTFDAISRNSSFCEQTKQRLHEFLVSVQKNFKSLARNENEVYKKFSSRINKFQNDFLATQNRELAPINIDSLVESLRDIENVFYEEVENKTDGDGHSNNDVDWYYVSSAREALEPVRELLTGSGIDLVNNPTALLVGDAGAGKSHLLADIALNRISAGRSCIFLLGQHFCTEEAPWTQILRNLLRLPCNESELLGVSASPNLRQH